MATRRAVNRDIRSFAFVWMGITIIMGVATFFGIYLTYGNTANAALNEGVVLPIINTQPPAENNAVAAAATAVPTQVLPTEMPPTALPPTEIPPTEEPEPTVVAQAAGESDDEADMEESSMVEEDNAEAEDMASEEEMREPGDFEGAEDSAEAMEEDPAEAMNTEPEAEDDTTPEIAEELAQEDPEIQPTALPVENRDFQVGVQVQYSLSFDPEIQNLWMNDVESLGLNWYKQQVRWEEIEAVQGEYDWAKLDLALPIAAERGINVAASVVAAPDWAREPGVDLSNDGPPADNADFVRFLTDMLERYPGQIHAIEIWNEPNLDREWMSSGGVSASNFVALQRVAYETIKAIDPGIIVISGAPSPTGGFVDGNGIVRAIDDFDYLDQMIAADLLNYTDCVGAHHNGYNISPNFTWDDVPDDPSALFRGPFDNPHHSWSFRSTLQTYATKIAVAGGDQPLCITEFGWASVEDMDGYPPNFEFAVDNTLEEQAEFTIDALNNMDEWGIVWLAFIWNLNYGPQAGWDTQSDNTPYSLIGPNWTRRPAMDAIAQWSSERREAEAQEG